MCRKVSNLGCYNAMALRMRLWMRSPRNQNWWRILNVRIRFEYSGAYFPVIMDGHAIVPISAECIKLNYFQVGCIACVIKDQLASVTFKDFSGRMLPLYMLVAVTFPLQEHLRVQRLATVILHCCLIDCSFSEPIHWLSFFVLYLDLLKKFSTLCSLHNCSIKNSVQSCCYDLLIDFYKILLPMKCNIRRRSVTVNCTVCLLQGMGSIHVFFSRPVASFHCALIVSNRKVSTYSCCCCPWRVVKQRDAE